jgi:hypothetical protein
MKIFVKIVLNILFVVSIVLFSISLTLKFLVLNPNFWKKTFNDNQIYSQLSTAIKNNLDSQVIAGGGSKSDAAPLTDLVTPDNLKDFINNNIDNLLGFINGKNKEIVVYIPVQKIPSSLLPTGIDGISEQMTLSNLLTEFNIQGVTVTQIEQVKIIGTVSTYIFVLSVILMILILFALNFSGLTILLGGLFVGIGAIIIVFFKNAITLGLSGEQSLPAMILRIISPPVLHQIHNLWFSESLIMFAIGAFLFFVKKQYNQSKKLK